MRRPRAHRAALLFVCLAACSDVERFPAEPDLPTPPEIRDATLTYDDQTGDAVLTWTAPDRNPDTPLDRYDIRFQYDGEFVFAVAQPVLDAPAPAAAGETQSYTLRRPELGRTLRMAVAALTTSDDAILFSNVAAVDVPGLTVSGRLVDAGTGGPVADASVFLIGVGHQYELRTDSDGHFEQVDLPVQQLTLSVPATGAAAPFHAISESFILDGSREQSYVMVPYEPTSLYPEISVLSLFREASNTYSHYTVFRRWETWPIPLHIPELVNDRDVDYRQAAMDAAALWGELVGFDVFEIVDDVPLVGVQMVFKSPEQMSGRLGITTHENFSDGIPKRSVISIVNTYGTAAAMKKTALHELGHGIRLDHLPYGYHMFGGQPIPNEPTEDEIKVVRLYRAIPIGQEMRVYLEPGEEAAP